MSGSDHLHQAYERMLGAYRHKETPHERQAWQDFLGELPPWAITAVLDHAPDLWPSKPPTVGQIRREVAKAVAKQHSEESTERAAAQARLDAERAVNAIPLGSEAIEAQNAAWAAEDLARGPEQYTPRPVGAARMRTIWQILEGDFVQ